MKDNVQYYDSALNSSQKKVIGFSIGYKSKNEKIYNGL